MRFLLLLLAAFFCAAAIPAPAPATKSHAITLFGEAKYKPGFTHFDYVNPNAPKGGTVKLSDLASFDSLNPFILKGVKAPGISMTFESLMVASLDEPQSMYGLIAESAVIPEDRSYAEFFLRPEARWHDGSPITPDDVVFSFETLKTKGDPFYRLQYAGISKVEKTGERSVKFSFAAPNQRELPIMAASMPIFSKAYFTAHDFEKSGMEAPLASGAYKVQSVDPGRAITYERVKDYWGKDLPVNRGSNNFDTIRYDIYRDETVALEAFKAGEYDFRQEYIARNWATAYDTPALKDGRMIKREVPHSIPQGMQAFVFNLRRDKFSDRRVREAIGLAMDFEWANKTLFYGAYKRNNSFFQNTKFSARGVPEGEELKLLEPYRSQLPPEVFTTEYNPPVTDGTGNDRKNLLRAQALLGEAGWVIKKGKRVNAKTGEPLTLEIMLSQPTLERAISSMRRNLIAKLGIDTRIRIADDSQYQKRLDTFDFDMVSIWINRGIFFPGNEQMNFWHSSQASVKGSNNLAGMKNPVVDAMLQKIVAARTEEELQAASKALDRVLLWQHVVIPHWHSNSFRIAWWDKFGRPDISPAYDIGFGTWWIKK